MPQPLLPRADRPPGASREASTIPTTARASPGGAHRARLVAADQPDDHRQATPVAEIGATMLIVPIDSAV